MEAVEQSYAETLRQQRAENKKAEKEKKAKAVGKSARKSVHFPLLLFLAAILKDALDIIPFVGFVTTPIFWLTVFIWFMNKDQISQKVLSYKMLLGGGVSFVIGLVPFVKIVPETSVFVYSIYKSEKKALKKGKAFLA